MSRTYKPETSKEIIPIFFATDDNYAPFLAVSIRSLLDNADKNYFYRIHILTSVMSASNKRKLTALAGENAKISFDNPEKKLAHIMESLAVRDYYSIATYYRLFIADMFPEYDKVVYIDSDTVVPGDISKMYLTDIGANLVGAIHDNVMAVPTFGEYVEKVLDVSRKRYFNAGILLMNLKQFRMTDMEGRFIELLSRRKFPVAQDQDYLNILCRDKVYYFGYEWNLVPVEGLTDKAPQIIHYKMALRPWHYDGIKYGEYFWKYAETSGYYANICEIKKNHSAIDKLKDKKVGEGLLALAREEIAKAENEAENEKESSVRCALCAL